MSEWEKLIRVREAGACSHHHPASALLYHRIAEDAEERLLDPVLAFNVHVRAIKEARSTSAPVKRSSVWPACWTAAGSRWPTPTPTCSIGVDARRRPRSASAWRACSRKSDDVAKAEETYRYVHGRAARKGRARQFDRIYSLLEQWPELAGVLEQRAVAADDTLDKVELYSRLGQVYEERLGRLDDAIRAHRVIFDTLAPTNEEAIAALGRIYEQAQAWQDLNTVYQRELDNAAGDVQEAEIRAKIAHLPPGAWATSRARSAGSACSTCAARIPKRCARWRSCTSSR